jgi:ribosomal protein L22
VQEARAILAFTPREVARDWSKLLESAVANAEHNHELLEDDLIVREATPTKGRRSSASAARDGTRDADPQAHQPPDDHAAESPDHQGARD